MLEKILFVLMNRLSVRQIIALKKSLNTINCLQPTKAKELRVMFAGVKSNRNTGFGVGSDKHCINKQSNCMAGNSY
jgi:hypothetical protein